jgi:hypothetical protein
MCAQHLKSGNSRSQKSKTKVGKIAVFESALSAGSRSETFSFAMPKRPTISPLARA